MRFWMVAPVAAGAIHIGSAMAERVMRVVVIDGDSIAIGDTRVRLWGIDAPERRQFCRESGRLYHRRARALDVLASRVRGAGGRMLCCFFRSARLGKCPMFCWKHRTGPRNGRAGLGPRLPTVPMHRLNVRPNRPEEGSGMAFSCDPGNGAGSSDKWLG